MKPIRDVRRERLALLVRRHGGQVAVAASVGKDKNQVYQWLQPPEKSASRNIGDSSARALEAALGYPAGWMDQPVTDADSSELSSEAAVGPAGQASQSVRPTGRTLSIAAGALTRFLARRHIELNITRQDDAELLLAVVGEYEASREQPDADMAFGAALGDLVGAYEAKRNERSGERGESADGSSRAKVR